MWLFKRAPLDLRQCLFDLESGNGLRLLRVDPGGGAIVVDALHDAKRVHPFRRLHVPARPRDWVCGGVGLKTRFITDGERGIKLDDVIESVNDEFKENEDLPNTTNPDDWARISGRKGERIINVRTLMTGISRKERSIENFTSGQYL